MDKLINESGTTKEKFIEYNKQFLNCTTIEEGFNLLLKEDFLCNIFKTFVGNSFYIKHKTTISILEKLVKSLYKENKKDYIVLENILKEDTFISIKLLLIIRLMLNIIYTGEKDKVTRDVILKTLNNVIDEIILTLH